MTVGFYLFILPYKKGEREFKAMFNPRFSDPDRSLNRKR